MSKKKLYARLETLLRNWLAGSKTVVSISRDATVLQTNAHETVVSQFMDNEHVDSEGQLSRVEHRPEERFNSVQCAGGIQHHMQTSFLGNTWDHNIAVCMVQNVCWHDGALE